jgi:FG-GAP-like repeat
MGGRASWAWGAWLLGLAACGGRAAHDSTSGVAGASSDAGATTHHCNFQGLAPFVSYVPAQEPLGLVLVDRSHTGHADLIVRERGNDRYSSELMANAGNGTFSLSAGYGASDNEASNVVPADFNGDGHTDLASLASGFPSDDSSASARVGSSWTSVSATARSRRNR